MNRLSSLLLAILLTAGLGLPSVQAQDAHPVRLLELHGPRTLFDGAVANYRARVSEGSSRPIGFLWDFGDGIASEGSPVAHRYSAPGTYTVTLVAYNAGGRDTMQTTITVSARPEVTASADIPDVTPRKRSNPVAERADRTSKAAPHISRSEVRRALFSNDPIAPTAEGYTWILASDLWNERLNRKRLQYRLQGLRVEIIADSSGRGSTAYRLIAGHFQSIGEALIARTMLDQTESHLQLHAFAPDGIQLAVSGFADALDQLSPDDRAGLDAGSAMNAMTPEQATPVVEHEESQQIAESPPAGTPKLPKIETEASTPPAIVQPSFWNPGNWNLPIWAWFLGGILVASGTITIALILYGHRAASTPMSQPTAVKKALPPAGLPIDRRPLRMLT